MLGHRRTSFRKAFDLLSALRQDTSDLSSLLALQQLLTREIMRAERRIPELRRLFKASADDASLERRLEGYRHTAYIWRCFGDAIAFLYMDKHALKHTFYHTDKLTAKQSAGFLGKDGMAREIAVVESAISHDVPAMLTDLTNTIRHGDVCLMGEADPYLLEVKTSPILNPRGKRQKRSVETLQSFFQTDFSRELRGAPYVHRVAFNIPERSYASEMAACIGEAMETGYGVRTPEPGLHYLAATKRSAVDKALSKVDLTGKAVFLLNEVKSLRSWSPYYPFTLSFEDFDQLWAFSRGTVYLMVAVDYSTMAATLIEAGHRATFDAEAKDFPVRFVLKSGEMGAIGVHLLTRVGLEFLSPSTMALSAAEIYRASSELVEERHRRGEDIGKFYTVPSPETWLLGGDLPTAGLPMERQQIERGLDLGAKPKPDSTTSA